MKKVLVVCRGNWDRSYYEPFARFGEYTTDFGYFNEKHKDQIALVVFTGGEDVNPALYNEACNPRTDFSLDRDDLEVDAWEIARKLNLPIAGICRGAQFICVMSGGKLVQHITGHHTYHDIRTDDGRLIRVSSTHHQMQLPPKDAVPIAWAEPKLSSCYLGGPGEKYEPEKEYDVVWYPSTRALGMQYHPEFMKRSTAGFQYCEELVTRFFGLKPTLQLPIEPLDFVD